ncbi:MAG: SsrA-binding protein SmpB [Myxococcaceae bacterium]|nr:SsrA-binding protein SmpB [Myxococcaceae bacterium]
MSKPKDASERLICEHRRAKFDYAFDETLEAGLVLTGSEVKALRNGEANLNDAYAMPEKTGLVLHNAHIGQYKPAASFAHLPTRPRPLLVNRNELEKWATKVRERGYSIIPLALYFKGSWAKVKLGLGKGKKATDRRDTIKERESKREMDRALRRR